MMWILVFVVVSIIFMVVNNFRQAPEVSTTKINFHSTEELEEEISHFNFNEAPQSATLSPHEIYLLKQAGYEVVQVVFGNVVFSMGVVGVLRTVFRAFTRGEMYDFTRLNRDARLLARNRLLQEAKTLGATHVFAVTFSTKEFADFIEIIATGTACKKVSDVSPQQIVVGV